MSIFATLANGTWLAANLPAWERFRAALQTPAETQNDIFHRLLTKNASSSYGRAFNFGGIRTYEQFYAQVPVIGYDDLEPWMARIMGGENAVLTSEAVTHLLPTSGSSGGCKYIPFTASLQREMNAAISPWVVDLFRQHPSLLTGTAYWSISPSLRANHEPSVVPIGFENDSNYLGGFRRRLAEATFAVPSALQLVADLDCLRYLTLLCLLRRRDLSLISVWHPSFLTLLLDQLPGWWDELLDDVATGGCRRAAGQPPEVRLSCQARPMTRRSRKLRQMGWQEASKIWPRLELVSCWADGQAAFASSGMQKRLPNTSVQAKGLLATEAFVTIPFQGLHPLAVASHFFEFVDQSGDILRCHELHAGETYSVIVSTGGGLWRYRLGDRVRVHGFIGNTPSLCFLGREGNVVDFCGEKLSEVFVSSAFEKACTNKRFAPGFAMLAPDWCVAGTRCYTFFVSEAPPLGFTEELDRELHKNPHYSLCCDLGQLAPLQCFCISGDASATYLLTCFGEGRKLGAIKPQTLSSRPDWSRVFAGSYVTAGR